MRLSSTTITSAVIAMAMLAALSPRAQAITLSVGATDSSVITLGGTTVAARAGTNTLNVSNPGGSAANLLGSVVTGMSRFSWNLAADNDTSASTVASATLTGDYSVEFTVSGVAPNYVYEVVIDTSLLGALTARQDAIATGPGGTASISDLTGTISGGPLGVGSLSLASAASQGDTSSSTGAQVVVDQAGVYTISGLQGDHTYTLNFTWTSSASSPTSTALQNPDELATRFGDPGPLARSTADDYPGLGARVIGNDGHFVSITATITAIPEPSTWILAGLGSLGLGLAGWRRKRD